MLRGHICKQALIITEGERYAILVDVAQVPVSRLGRPDEASGGDRDAFVLSTARTLFDLPETLTLYDLSNRYFDGHRQPRISAIPCAPLLRAVSSISGCSPPSA